METGSSGDMILDYVDGVDKLGLSTSDFAVSEGETFTTLLDDDRLSLSNGVGETVMGLEQYSRHVKMFDADNSQIGTLYYTDLTDLDASDFVAVAA